MSTVKQLSQITKSYVMNVLALHGGHLTGLLVQSHVVLGRNAGNSVNMKLCTNLLTQNVFRNVDCSLKKTVVDNNECSLPKPQTVSTCNTNQCPVWKTSDWSECSAICGEGVKTRQAFLIIFRHLHMYLRVFLQENRLLSQWRNCERRSMQFTETSLPGQVQYEPVPYMVD